MTYTPKMIEEVIDCRKSSDVSMFPLDSHDIIIVMTIGRSVAGADDRVCLDPDAAASMFTDPRTMATMVLPQDLEWPVATITWGLAQHSSSESGTAICKQYDPRSHHNNPFL
jgi:hypothetical protein